MFRITEDPSSGSLVQCLAKNYKNGSIVSVDMDKFGVMAAYSDRCACVYSSLYRKALLCSTVKNIDAPMLTRVWQELEYRIDVCRVTRGAHIEHL